MLRLTLGLACIVCTSVRADETLEWVSKDGHKIQATFEGLEVVLTKEDGRKIRVPYNALSVASRTQALRLNAEDRVQQVLDDVGVGAGPVQQKPREEKQPDVLTLARQQKILGEIREIKHQAELQGSTAKNDIFLKEEMSKLDAKYGKLKVKLTFPVRDVFQGDGSYKLRLGSCAGPLGRGSFLGMDRGAMYVGRQGYYPVRPVVTKQEMMEIGRGTHQYEVVCEITIYNVGASTFPPIAQADCKLVKIRPQ